MKRILNYFLMPHILIWGIIGLLVYELIPQVSYIPPNIVVVFIGILLLIFAPKISLWWNERINKQRKSLADRYKISSRSARLILYGLPARFFDVWAFRIYGLFLTLLGFYNIYTRYLKGSLNQGLDNDITIGIILTIIFVFCLIQMWLTRPYKKIVIGLGVSWTLIFISYVLSMYVSEVFSLIGILSFISLFVFLVRMIKAYRKFKNRES